MSRGILRLLAVAGVAAAASLALASGAQATTYCVNFDPGDCSGSQKATIAGAISAAQSHSGRDKIKIDGGHIYQQPPLVVNANNPVDIVGTGSGSGQPLLAANATSGQRVLWVKNASSTVENIGISVGGTSDTGLVFGGKTVSDVNVQGSSALDGATGIELDNGTLSDSTVVLDHASPGQTYALIPDSAVTIKDTTLTADVGALVGCCVTDATFERDQITARLGVELAQHGSLTLDDSLIVVKGPGTITSAGILADEFMSGDTTSVDVRGSTIYNRGSGTYGLEAYTTAGTASVAVHNSIVRNFGTDALFATGSGASITSDFSDYSSHSTAGGGTVTTGAHDVDVAPGFVDASTGDYHLTSASALIDVGSSGPLAAGEPDLDLYGNDRRVAGHSGNCAVRDIGAAEYQPSPLLPPRAEIVSSTATPTVGDPVDLDGSLSCSSSSKATLTSYAWSFDDGGSATGAHITHAWATPGMHSATLTVTDSLGRTNMTSRAIDVQPGPPPDNSFTIGKPRLDKHAGTAKLPVTVPGPGKLKLKGKGLKTKSLTADAAGKVKLPVKPKGNKKHKLKQKGKATVKAKVTFTPTGGTAKTKTKTVYLKRKAH